MSKIKIISEQREYDGYLKIDKAIIEDTDDVGKIVKYNRFKLTRPDAVAIVVYNEDTDEVILVRQHRYPIDNRIDENVLEIIAGKIDDGENPKDAAIRETKEEIGFEIKEGKIGLLNSFFTSPGYSSEKIYLFLAFVKEEDKVTDGGGVDGEHENIEVESYKASIFFDMVASGEIVDSKTLIGAQALWHFRNADVIEAGRRFIENQRLEYAKNIADKVIKDTDNENK